MRYRLRTLLIVLALGPVLIAVAFLNYAANRAEQDLRTPEEVWARLPGGGQVRIYPRDYGDVQFTRPSE